MHYDHDDKKLINVLSVRMNVILIRLGLSLMGARFSGGSFRR